jgi:hypothetical protein
MLAIAHRISNDSGEAWPSINTLAREANISRSMVKIAIRDLVQMGELELTRGGKGPKDTHTFRFPRFLVWIQTLHANKGPRFDPLSAEKGAKHGPPEELEFAKKGSESVEKGAKPDPEPLEPSLRATINKTKSAAQVSTGIHDWIPLSLWTAFREMRLQMHKPMPEGVVDLLIRRLEALRDEGNDVTEVIAQSIRNGWADFYEIKREKHRANRKCTSVDEADERIRRNMGSAGLSR